MTCAGCATEITGEWAACPLCGGELSGARRTAPQPDIRLRYDRKRLLATLALASLVLVAGSAIAVRFFPEPINGFALVWFAVAAVWLVAFTAVRKRRNFAKAIVYGVVLVSLLVLYADHWQGWRGWSVDWVIPLLCSSAIVAILVAVRIARMRVADYVIYLWSAAFLGFVPALFMLFGFTGYTVPSWISIGLAIVASLSALLLHRSETVNELRKRFSI